MKIKNMTLSTLLIALLSACGSSGGSGTNEINHAHNQFNISGNGNVFEKKANAQVANPMTHIIINGKTYELPTRSDEFEFPADNIEGWVERFNHMVIGAYGTLNSPELVGTAFIQGNITPIDNMPTTGIFTYETPNRDSVVWDKIIGPNESETYQDGTGRFTVDFGAKKLTGSVSGTDYQLGNRPDIHQTIELAADIKGNQFEGTKDDFTFRGGFFGPNAEEMGGLFEHSDKKTSGWVGATKQ